MTGLLRFLNPYCAVALPVALILAARRPLITTLGLTFLLGSMSGRIAWIRESSGCAARLSPGELGLSLQLLEPADRSGGLVQGQPLHMDCRGPIAARWPSGHPFSAGASVLIRGRWIPRAGPASRPGGTLVVESVSAAGRSGRADRYIRTWISGATESLYGTRAPLVDALVVGRRGGINRDLQDRFAQSGLVHLLSISGFHVGVITGWVFLLATMVRLSRSRALVLAAIISLTYVAFLGWPAPATRAAALAVLLALSRVRQRRVDPNARLSATCLCVLLVDPWSILDLGGWLSVAALWGASTVTRWTDQALGNNAWWRMLGSSIGATIATAPLTATALGTVALVGIVLNFVAIPLAAFTIPGVFASLLIFPLWPGVAAALAGGAGLGLHGLELLARAGAAVPGGHVVEAAELRSAWPWLGALMVTLWATRRRNTLAEAIRRWSWSGVGALWLALLTSFAPGSADTGSKLALHFLDVGQGDGALLRTPAGHWVLIDGGPKTDQSDAGRRVMVPFLARHGVGELSLAFVSHAHADHLGGVISVLDRYRSGVVVEPGEPVADPLYYAFLNELASEAIPWHVGARGEHFTLDSVNFSILHPDHHWTHWGEDLNEDSLVLLVEYGNFQAIFAGDAGIPAEREMRSRTRRVDLLKVGHHGSRGSTGDEWLDSLRPRAAVISVGRNNYGHPSPATLDRLRRHGIAVWRTDQDGTVSVTTDGREMTVQSRGRRVTYSVQ
ncbi:MAG: DNA internalization-related competence protein ComEC/Rec2 [Gemmatimonadales bacterium]